MIKSFFAKIYAGIVARQVYKWADDPVNTQEKVFHNLLKSARNTAFGSDHNFSEIMDYESYKKKVPVRDYEGLKDYIERIRSGEKNVLWKGKPIYFAKTSGTTSGAKYIPISKESMPYQIAAAKEALLLYIAETGNADFVDGKMIFLQGSPEIEDNERIKTGRLSGIVAHYVPKYLQKNRLPSWETNCIEDWEEKVDAIVKETVVEDMRLISGIPSWVQMYFEKLIRHKGKKVSEIFPNFKLFVYGGVNYEPYRQNMEDLIGTKVDSIELFPASEGFFAYQDRQQKDSDSDKGMLLLLNSGIFYEFIAADDFFNDNPERISIKDVKLGVNYVLIISTNAGLWSYNIGDTVAFTSLSPYRVIVTGRIKHFISAFGEHVIGKEVEESIQHASKISGALIKEFTVAPQVNPKDGVLPYHEWFIEFEKEPADLESFANELDKEMQHQNSYYFDLLQGNILQRLIIRRVKKNGFDQYMRSIGKLGGQNKIPRLSNDRKIADQLTTLID
ncbi:GH3 auxin-responsive promoter family protein [Lutimonas saemankumensis]|uniref:GH3 auxin-responsive promoter family protein n=1 Tax=Lutimonas saemankumensis TaxID=483016 RepID=UPI001CD4CE2F|nr:GH3 auxin-responsive promoter family protein [Lutimonas saemankumensis]MCA0932908.1 GH3 auxin-responsive promoter family protein [Lutimonas saemankumensis]